MIFNMLYFVYLDIYVEEYANIIPSLIALVKDNPIYFIIFCEISSDIDS